jgi:phosphoribosylformylglycinamidine synthase
MAIVPDVRQCVTMDLKAAGDWLYLVGETRSEMGGSHLNLVTGAPVHRGLVPRVNLARAKRTYEEVHAAIRARLVRACHDLSEGGLAVAAAEMCVAGNLGLQIRLDRVPVPEGEPLAPEAKLFSESPSRFLVEVATEKHAEFEKRMAGVPCACIGFVTAEPLLTVDPATSGDEREELLVRESVADLKTAWRGTLDW